MGRELSLEEWIGLPEDEEGELVDGRLTEEEQPDPVHSLAVTWLMALLHAWLADSGFVFGSQIKLVVGERSGRKPDVSAYLPGRRRAAERCATRPTSSSR